MIAWQLDWLHGLGDLCSFVETKTPGRCRPGAGTRSVYSAALSHCQLYRKRKRQHAKPAHTKTPGPSARAFFPLLQLVKRLRRCQSQNVAVGVHGAGNQYPKQNGLPPIFPSNNNRNNNLAPTIYAIRAPQPRFVIALLSVPRKDPRYSSQVNFEYVAGLPRYLARACPLVTRIRSIRPRCNATHRLAFFGKRPGGGHSIARADLRSRRFRSRDPRGCPWSPSPRLAVPYAPA